MNIRKTTSSAGTVLGSRHVRHVVAFVLLASIGCTWKGDQRSRREQLSDDVWEIIPIRMRVYPSSRFKRVQNQTILEARIELFDDVGDSVKGVGRLHFELYAQAPRTPRIPGTPRSITEDASSSSHSSGDSSERIDVAIVARTSGDASRWSTDGILSSSNTGPLLYTWDVEMLSIDQNRRFFDRITRSYLFRLRVNDPPAIPRATQLHVAFTRPDGKRLQVASILVMPGRG